MNVKNLSDEQLAKAVLKNNDLFEHLIGRFEKKLIRFILHISNFNKEEAEEILQEIFIKVWRNLREYEGDAKFSSWIFRIARNETISEFRKHTSRGLNKKIEMEYEDFARLKDKIDIKNDLSKKLDGENVHKILSYLPQKYKDVLILKFIEEKSTTEISDILEKPEKTISTLIHRAKKDFKNRAEKLLFFN